MDWLVENEAVLRWYAIAIGFAVVGAWECFRPRRESRSSAPVRWAGHFFLAVFGNLLALWSLGVGSVAFAMMAQTNPYGLLNHDQLPLVVKFCAGVLIIDVFIYWRHRLVHAVPFLWRFHEAHHSDPDFDQTTGLRFHPGEAMFGLAWGLGVLYLVAPPPSAVAFVEVTFIYITYFSHSNVRLSERTDGLLRRLLITPDMHRVHHSTDPAEQRRNYGAYLSCWDHLFGTYQHQPALGHERMGVGSAEVPESEALNPLQLLIRPFRSRKSLESSRRAVLARPERIDAESVLKL